MKKVELKKIKFNKFKQKLENELTNHVSKIKPEFKKKKEKKSFNEVNVIGVTGSYGKSTVCLMIHEYLKKLGYKSVLYSSVSIDSPVSLVKKGEECELALNSKEELLDIIEEVENYGADYLVLEVNENTIKKGLVDDIPFTMKVLTNLNPKHNLEEYTEEEYVNVKKSFFENSDKNCIHVIGFQDYEKELFKGLLKLANGKKYTFSTRYVSNIKGLNESDFTTLLYEYEKGKEKTKLKFKLNEKDLELTYDVSKQINVFSILCMVTVFDALDLLDLNTLSEILNELKVPGRCEIKKVNDRVIVIDAHLSSTLEYLKELKERGEVDRIVVLTGSVGSGFATWEEKYNSGKNYKYRKLARKYAMELVNKYADVVYLTENDNAAESVLDICDELKSYLSENITKVTITDRYEAIRKVLLDSKPKDAIFISGRGNRTVLCNSKDTVKLQKDSEAVEEIITELGW